MPALTLLVIADPAAPHLKALSRLPEDTRVIISNDLDLLLQAAPEADIIFNGDFSPRNPLRQVFLQAARTRWVHTISTGVDTQLWPEIIASPVPMTNARGVFRRPLGEWAVAAMLYFCYDLRRDIRQQEAGVWERFESRELAGQTVGIVGYGEIGRAAAERARPFGMRIVALRRNPHLSENDPLVDAAYPPELLREMLAVCDFVVAAAPLTPSTRGMIGTAEIAAMKPTAVIINVGRGAVIDEPALVAALQTGTIAGAALDVFATEPLPAGHAFYSLKNVLLSPHCADWTPGWLDRSVQLFLDNFDRLRKGEPLENIVDKHAGY
jgi:phosphoglycerate dehydrogenase-like enzyme